MPGHVHNHTIDGGHFTDLPSGKGYKIMVCACGDEKIVWD